MNIPTDLWVADVISAVFLSLGAFFLMKFFMKFGSEKSKRYSFLIVISLFLYAIFHEGSEIIYGLYGKYMGITGSVFTASFSVLYLIAALLLTREIKQIITGGKHVRKYDK